MALRIMGSKRRIPRKIKKALKYAFLHPRVCGRLIRYGAVYTIGRYSKWTRKAAKIKRRKEETPPLRIIERMFRLFHNARIMLQR